MRPSRVEPVLVDHSDPERADSCQSSQVSTGDKHRIGLTKKFSGAIPVGSFLLFCVAGLFTWLLFPDLHKYLGCSRENLLGMRLHTLVTYSALHFSVGHLLRVTVSSLLSVWFIEDSLSKKNITVLILGSALLGAALFCVLVKPPGTLVGGAMVCWGLGGAVLGVGIFQWRHLGSAQRGYFIIVSLCTLGVVLMFTAMGYVQLLVAAASFAWVCFRCRRDRSKAHNHPLHQMAEPPVAPGGNQRNPAPEGQVPGP